MALLTNINGKFSVSDAGAVTFNNAFTFPTVDGDANYVLKTNGSGQLAWAADNDGGDITGSGTANTVTKFTGAKVISDGPITFSSNDSTFAGDLTVPHGKISLLGGNNLTISGTAANHAGLSFATNAILPGTSAATNTNVFDLGATTERFKNLYLGSEIISEGGATFAGNISFPNSNLSSTAATTNFGVYNSEVRLIDTPNGGLKSCRVITDNYGEWILVGRFAANAMTSIQGVWSSVTGLSLGTAQNETTQFSADFGDSYPTEVRIMGATDFTKWRDTRTIDFVYGVPEGRQWKFFFSGGVENGMAASTKYGWAINGSYDGFGRWVNPAQNFVRMSDTSNVILNPSAAYTTATTNAFNWDTNDDAKFSVSATRVFSGQDTFCTAAVGADDNVFGFFDKYPSEISNFQGSIQDFSSAVWVLIKLPNVSSGGGGASFWKANGNDIYNTNSGDVGIGTTSPTSISANTNSLTVGSSRNDLSGGIIYQSNGAIRSQMYWDSAGLQTVVNSGDARWYTGGVNDRLRITSSGNIGIGTGSPQSYDNESDNLVVAEGVNGTDPTPGITIACLADQATTGRGAIRFADGAVGNAAYRGALEYNHNGDNMFFRTSSTVKMTLNTDGNLGIGTTIPQSKLHIETGSGGTYNPNTNHDDVTIEGSGNIGLQLFSPNTSYQYIAFGDPNSVNAGYLRYYHGANEMVFRTNGSDNMIINSAGNVGIGSTIPDAKLEVVQPSGDGAAGTPTLMLSNDPTGQTGYTWQSWRYNENNSNYRLDLKQRVTSGVVRYSFNMVNNGTSFDDVLVLDRGKVGIGTTDPRARGLEIFRAAGLSSTPQFIISTGESSSRDYSFATDVMAAGDFAILDGVASSVANVRMRFVDGGTTIAFRDNNTTELGRYVSTNSGGAVKRIRMRQGGEIHFGDTATSNPCGITEGAWNTFTDQDFLSIYARNKLDIYTYPNGNTLTASIGRSDGTSYILGTLGIGLTSVGNFSLRTLGAISGTNIYANSNGGGFVFGASTSEGEYITRPSGTSNMNFYTSGSPRIVIESNGEVGINNTLPSATLHLTALTNNGVPFKLQGHNTTTVEQMLMYTSKAAATNWYWIVAQANSVNQLIIYGNGDIKNKNNSYGQISDVRLKENIVDARPKLEDIKKLKVKNFNLIGDDLKQIGLIAQEVEEVFPGLVNEDKEPDIEGGEEGGVYKSVKYSVLVPILIKAMQEQQEIIDDLKSRIEQLEN